ncbi:hypothetical protein [Glycomyces sp. NPDC048151]|uniref:hypothetical protein n=1 Tax=Glycomyces sp. NPDC048151 TaxID=3364002 RepID=UPI00370F7A7E
MIDPNRMLRESLDRTERIQAELAAESGRVFERVSETGLCRVFVGLDGNLLDVVFYRTDVFGIEEPSAVSQEILVTIKAARAEAAAESSRIVERVLSTDGTG